MKLLASIVVFGCLLSLCLTEEAADSPPRVVTPLGSIEGYYKISSSGRRYEAYEGIPYAHPPIGESRFKISRSISQWTGILMAKQFGPPCLQYNQPEPILAKRIQGSEDCLYLNVYTSIRKNDSASDSEEIGKPSTNLLPVIFYIHGGALNFGSGDSYGPKYLLDRNVTLVTINYRVGPLGFLSTEDETVPGNMGLKDQVIALQWVKNNVQSFGGDPSRVTIFGHSSGASCVQYHYLTNLTTGLFHGGMSLSGVVLNPMSQVENSLEKAKKLAAILGCPTGDVRGMVDCLRARPAHQIVGVTAEFMGWKNNPIAPFGPVVEKGGGEFTFIDRLPIEILTSGDVQDVPWITGLVSEEGLYPMAYYITDEKLAIELNDNWETIAPHLLDFNYTIPKMDHPRVARLIKEHYLGTSLFGRSTIEQSVRMVSDRLFIYDVERSVKLQARVNRSPVLFYYFSYRGVKSESDFMSGIKENIGVSHEDDLMYVMESHFDPTTRQRDWDVHNKLIDLWVSFASDGVPNMGVEWPAVSRSTDEFQCLHIAGPEAIGVMDCTPIFGEMNFWRDLGLNETTSTYINQTIK